MVRLPLILSPKVLGIVIVIVIVIVASLVENSTLAKANLGKPPRPLFDARGGSQTIVDLEWLSQLWQVVTRPWAQVT